MRNRRAFSLVELIVVMAILGVLVTLSAPNIQSMLDKARKTACMSNLRQIGLSVRNYANDNDNTMPVIEMDPENNIYPPEVEARSMLETLGPYGVTVRVLRCPADVAGPNYYALHTNSYQWLPRFDDENLLAPITYRRNGDTWVAKPSRVSFACDYTGVHNGRSQRVYADGSVR